MNPISASAYLVTVFPDTNERHVLPLYAALADLAVTGRVSIRFSTDIRRTRFYRPFSLWMEVRNPDGRVRTLCFDMADDGRIVSPDGLRKCDVYFKRSYLEERLRAELPDGLFRKIRPYGFYFSCRSRNENGLLRRIGMEHRMAFRALGRHYFVKMPRLIRQNLRLALSPRRIPGLNASGIQYLDTFERLPEGRPEPRVLFQSRVWDPDRTRAESADVLEELNEERAETVRTLRDGLGNAFVGGLLPTEYARRRFPDCVTKLPTEQDAYLARMKRCRVAVNTLGLSRSIGGKLPEYLAAGRCIVSAPLHYRSPEPLEPGVHFLEFRSPAECLDACRNLLADPIRAEAMATDNRKYYEQHVRPSALLRRHLDDAFSDAEPCGSISPVHG